MELKIASQGIINEEVVIVEAYSIYIPIATNKKVSTMEVVGLYGDNIDELDSTFEYALENLYVKKQIRD